MASPAGPHSLLSAFSKCHRDITQWVDLQGKVILWRRNTPEKLTSSAALLFPRRAAGVPYLGVSSPPPPSSPPHTHPTPPHPPKTARAQRKCCRLFSHVTQDGGKKKTPPQNKPKSVLGFPFSHLSSLPFLAPSRCHTCPQVLTSPERISLDLVTSRHKS